MITAWRITSKKRKSEAFAEDGARINGGRWNKKGTAVVYTSSTISLASMEILVNLPSISLLDTFVWIPVQFEDDLVEVLNELPDDWDSRPAATATKAIGVKWASENRSVVLKVPSVVIPLEYNYLLNPNHPDWHKVVIQDPITYDYDPRI